MVAPIGAPVRRGILPVLPMLVELSVNPLVVEVIVALADNPAA
ncbi:hypothetical protein [Gordonia crocea]|nr:hypothetical protein [Gordonia crocea]